MSTQVERSYLRQMVKLIFLAWHSDEMVLSSADSLVEGSCLDMPHTRKLFCEKLLNLLHKIRKNNSPLEPCLVEKIILSGHAFIRIEGLIHGKIELEYRIHVLEELERRAIKGF